MGKANSPYAPSRTEVTKVAQRFGVSRSQANRAIRLARRTADREGRTATETVQ